MLKKRAAARAAKQKKMRDALLRTRQEELEWIAKLSQHAVKEDEVLAEVRAKEAAALAEKSKDSMLHLYEKAEALKRQRKKEEYERMQRLVGAMEEEKKRQIEAEEKAKTARERQDHQKRLLLMKHHAERELEAMKATGRMTGLNKLLGAGKAAAKAGGEEGEEGGEGEKTGTAAGKR